MWKKYHPPKLDKEDIENLNSPIAAKKIEAIIKKLPRTKVQVQMVLQVNPIKHSEKNYNHWFSGSSKILKRPESYLTHFMRWLSYSSPRWQRQHQQRKLKTNLINEYRCKNPQNNLSKSNTTIHQKIVYHDKVGFIPEMQGWFNIQKSVNIIHHINKKKDKIHMIISIDAEKTFDKSQHYSYLLLAK